MAKTKRGPGGWTHEKAIACVNRQRGLKVVPINPGYTGGTIEMRHKPGIKVLGAIDFLEKMCGYIALLDEGHGPEFFRPLGGNHG